MTSVESEQTIYTKPAYRYIGLDPDTIEADNGIFGTLTIGALSIGSLNVDDINEVTLNHGVTVQYINMRYEYDYVAFAHAVIEPDPPAPEPAGVALMLAPLGPGGGIVTALPDGTPTGGNSRGIQAIDFQINRTAANQVASGARSVVAGGSRNRAEGATSGVLCGDQCQIVGASPYAFIGAGNTNTITDSIAAVISGGATNAISLSDNAAISGGSVNTISAASAESVISGGNTQTMTASSFSNISGGGGNTHTNQFSSAIAGGLLNVVSHSAVGTGNTIAGGISNAQTDTDFSTIAGGADCTIGGVGFTSSYGLIGCGFFNGLGTTANTQYSVIANGNLNSVQSSRGFVGTGDGNSIQAGSDYCSVLNGINHTIIANSARSTICGGTGCTISNSQDSVVAAGSLNQIILASNRSFIGTGATHTISGSVDSAVVAGQQCDIIGSAGSIIGNGNVVDITGGSTGSAIVAGNLSNIRNASVSSFIGAAVNSSIGSTTASSRSAIVSGTNNAIDNSIQSFIGTGSLNNITASPNSAILCGANGAISAASSGSVIVRASTTTINGASVGAIVLGGVGSTVSNASEYVMVGTPLLASVGATTTSSYSGIVAGNSPSIDNAQFSFIGTGNAVAITDNSYSSIINGDFNTMVGAAGARNTILNGTTNTITNSTFSLIAGGSNNAVTNATYGTILGGSNSAVNANYGLAWGTNAVVNNAGSVVLSDSTLVGATDPAANSFVAKFAGGIRFDTGAAAPIYRGNTIQEDWYASGTDTGVGPHTLFTYSVPFASAHRSVLIHLDLTTYDLANNLADAYNYNCHFYYAVGPTLTFAAQATALASALTGFTLVTPPVIVGTTLEVRMNGAVGVTVDWVLRFRVTVV
jgi:hypothetical protein